MGAPPLERTIACTSPATVSRNWLSECRTSEGTPNSNRRMEPVQTFAEFPATCWPMSDFRRRLALRFIEPSVSVDNHESAEASVRSSGWRMQGRTDSDGPQCSFRKIKVIPAAEHPGSCLLTGKSASLTPLMDRRASLAQGTSCDARTIECGLCLYQGDSPDVLTGRTTRWAPKHKT